MGNCRKEEKNSAFRIGQRPIGRLLLLKHNQGSGCNSFPADAPFRTTPSLPGRKLAFCRDEKHRSEESEEGMIFISIYWRFLMNHRTFVHWIPFPGRIRMR
jgi:hypothetical protein